MSNEKSEKHGARGKTLAELWLMRYLVESKLDIKNPKDIDPFAFVLWLQSRLEPSPGQKGNIAAAIRKHVGLDLPPIFGKPREVLEVIKPSKETYKSTLDALCSFRNNAPIELYEIRDLAVGAFLFTSVTGLSIAELRRSDISNIQEIYSAGLVAGKEKYEFIISTVPSDGLKASNPLPKLTYIKKFDVLYMENIKYFLTELRNVGSAAEYKKFSNKIQYIIYKNNQAKGVNLRQLRSLYPGILGFLKYTD